jgi:hypothetical protein
VSPGTDAAIVVGKSEGTQQIQLDARHLSPPDRLGEGLAHYAAWVIPGGSPPILAGVLRYDAGARTGRLRATTPYESFDLIVTAEPSPICPSPTGPVVLQQEVR